MTLNILYPHKNWECFVHITSIHNFRANIFHHNRKHFLRSLGPWEFVMFSTGFFKHFSTKSLLLGFISTFDIWYDRNVTTTELYTCRWRYLERLSWCYFFPSSYFSCILKIISFQTFYLRINKCCLGLYLFDTEPRLFRW